MSKLDYSLLPVDKAATAPVTLQIVELVLKNIESLILTPGDRLPTERELAERLGVARGTVKAAYKKLERQNIIQTRQGSGSFIIRDEELTRRLRREKAMDMLYRIITELVEMGLGQQEISQLFEACLSREPGRVTAIAIIHDTPELLLDFKRQLSFLPNVSISIFILESVTETREPEALLRGFDVIVVPISHHKDVLRFLPGIGDRVIQAAVAPSSETLINLSALPRNVRIGIICRSSAFLAIVKEILRSYGFLEANIQSFFEMDYTTETYFPGGIDALISFGDAHIFTNPAFTFRNEEFWAKGGKIIAFKHQFERGTLIYIEDRVRRLSAQKKPAPNEEI